MLSNFKTTYDDATLVSELEKQKLDVKKLNKILANGDIKINGFLDKEKKLTYLHKFIKGNSLASTQWLLQNHANPYTEDEHHLPAFFYFIHSPIANKLYHILEENNVDFSFKNSQGRMVLQDIVINGDIALYNRVIRKVKKPFSVDSYGRNVLFDAISSGDKDTMNLVFDHEDAPLDIQDNEKNSLLHFVKDGDLNLIEFLLNKGVSPSIPDINEKNIIFYLSERVEKSSSVQDIKQLTALIDMALQSKNSLTQKDQKGNNLLLGFLNTLNKPLASYNQKSFLSDLISKFIKSGVDINEKNKEGDNALFLAIEKNDLETAMLLLENDADINIANMNQETPLSFSVLKGTNEYLEMVKLLLEHKANPNIKDPTGVCIFEKIVYILLYINKKNLKQETKQELTEEDENLDLDKFNEDDFIRTTFELIVSGKLVDFDAMDSQGNPFFFIQVFSENNYNAELLFKAGANINQTNSEGKNILEYYIDFVKKNEVDENLVKKIIKNIVKFGIDLSKRDDQGATLLHNTILKEPLSMSKNIIGVGASINVTDKKGRTLLHNAIWANDIDKVRFIIGIKKDLLNIPDKLGIMPINYAVFFGNKELTYYLLSLNGYVNNLHEKQKATLDFFKRFHKNVIKLENEENEEKVKNRQMLTLLVNMKKEFMIVD